MPVVYNDFVQNNYQNNCFALTIRREYKIQTAHRFFGKSLSISFRSMIAGAILTILKILI